MELFSLYQTNGYLLPQTFLQVFHCWNFLLNPKRFKDQMLHLASLPHKNLNLFHSDGSAARKGIISFSLAFLMYHDTTFRYKIKREIEWPFFIFQSSVWLHEIFFSFYDFPFVFRIVYVFCFSLLRSTFASHYFWMEEWQLKGFLNCLGCHILTLGDLLKV